MGGRGSGRPPSVETLINRQKPEETPVGDELYLPDYSGIKDDAKKTSATDIVSNWTLSGSNIYNSNSGNVGIGVTDPHSKLEVNGAISSATLTLTASADNTDVSGVNTIFVTTASGNVVLGGLTGGVEGQFLYIVRKDATNDLTLEHAEGVGDQDLIMHEATDETIGNYGGFTFVCDGSDWYDVSHAKHV